MPPIFQTSALLEGSANARHGFFGRRGGVSSGLYLSLNCSFNASDDRENVRQNRASIAAELGGNRLITNRQVHGRQVRRVDGETDDEALFEADGLVTTTPGICIGALGADCAPVLFSAPGVVGAAHAGWQGALKGVTDAVIETMTSLGVQTDEIVAAIGPAIQFVSYEVGDAFRDRFLAESPLNADECFGGHPGTGNVHFDLPRYIETRLRAAGIRQIDRSQTDTYADERGYFSYRRTCHRNEPDYGRQVGAIGLLPT